MSCQGIALLYYFLCRNMLLLHFCAQPLVAAGIWVLQQRRNGTEWNRMELTLLWLLLPLGSCHASMFISKFSPHVCKEKCEGLCWKSVHSPCTCWTVVQQRKWQSSELRKLNVISQHCVIYPAHGGKFILQIVCAYCWTQGGITVSALGSNGPWHYPAEKEGLVSWMWDCLSEALKL